MQDQYHHPCAVCGRAIERRWQRCFRCRNVTVREAKPFPVLRAYPTPTPQDHKRIRLHRGWRTEKIKTLN